MKLGKAFLLFLFILFFGIFMIVGVNAAYSKSGIQCTCNDLTDCRAAVSALNECEITILGSDIVFGNSAEAGISWDISKTKAKTFDCMNKKITGGFASGTFLIYSSLDSKSLDIPAASRGSGSILNCEINGNDYGKGIVVKSYTDKVGISNFNINYNNIHDTTIGIQINDENVLSLNSGQNVKVNYNKIHDNEKGVDSVGLKNSEFINNEIYSNQDSGLIFKRLDNSNIKDNRIYSNGLTTSTFGNGIEMYGSNYNTLESNKIYSNGKYISSYVSGAGISFEAPSSWWGPRSIYSENSVGNILKDNYITKNKVGINYGDSGHSTAGPVPTPTISGTGSCYNVDYDMTAYSASGLSGLYYDTTNSIGTLGHKSCASYAKDFGPQVSLVRIIGGSLIGSSVAKEFVSVINPGASLIKNYSLYIWSSSGALVYYSKQIQSVPSGTVSSILTYSSLLPGSYNWNYLACDVNEFCNWATKNFSFVYDTANPAVTLNSPANDLTTSTWPVSFDALVTDDSKLLKSADLYVWKDSQIDSNIVSNINWNPGSYSIPAGVLLNFKPLVQSYGKYVWNYKVCDPAGNCAFAPSSRTLIYQASDASVPVISNIVPVKGGTLSSGTFTLTFQTDESASCRASLQDKGYNEMGSDFSCTSGFATSHSCSISGLTPSSNPVFVYLACSDNANVPNSHTSSTNENVNYVYPLPVETCADSDNGQNVNDFGSASKGSITISDSCLNGKVSEAYCNAGVPASIQLSCDSGKVCSAGKCILAVPPVITINSVGGDTNPFSVNSLSPVAQISSNLESDCKASLTSVSFDQMAISCTSSDKKSHSCSFSSLSEGKEKNLYFACKSILDNAIGTLTAVGDIDKTAPQITIASFSSSQENIISSASLTLPLTTDEAAFCRWSLTDQAYSAISSSNSCTSQVSGASTHSCSVSGYSTSANAQFKVYISCKDFVKVVPNEHSVSDNKEVAFKYSLSTSCTSNAQCTTAPNTICTNGVCVSATATCIAGSIETGKQCSVCKTDGSGYESLTSACTGANAGKQCVQGQCVAPTTCTDADWEFSLSPVTCPASGQQTKTWSKKASVICSAGVDHNPLTENVQCTPTTPSACQTDGCTTLNEKVCSGSGVKTCNIVNGCLQWSSVTACASGETCASGTCSASTPVQSINSARWLAWRTENNELLLSSVESLVYPDSNLEGTKVYAEVQTSNIPDNTEVLIGLYRNELIDNKIGEDIPLRVVNNKVILEASLGAGTYYFKAKYNDLVKTSSDIVISVSADISVVDQTPEGCDKFVSASECTAHEGFGEEDMALFYGSSDDSCSSTSVLTISCACIWESNKCIFRRVETQVPATGVTNPDSCTYSISASGPKVPNSDGELEQEYSVISSGSASDCQSGTTTVNLQSPVRIFELPFFNWVNGLAAILIIIALYLIIFKTKKPKNNKVNKKSRRK